MRDLPDKAFDLAIVDPPYGIERFKKNVESKKMKNFTNKLSKWDKKPEKDYFIELQRVSNNQIIWGANYFWNENLKNGPSFIFWDKMVCVKNFSDGEIAWTSFPGLCRKFQYAWGGLNDGIIGRNKTEKKFTPLKNPLNSMIGYCIITQNLDRE
jgi:site-specific DNA-methyltransferase (adenine-specific)